MAFTPGQKVYYYSGTHKKYLVAYVVKDNGDGSVDLDVRKAASVNSISTVVPKGFTETNTGAASKAKTDQIQLTGVLAEFGRDLVAVAKENKIEPCVGRNDEIRSVMQILARRTKNNPIVVGEPGVGKTKIIYGLAQRLANDDVPPALKGKRIISVDVGSLVAGAGYKGQFEERVKDVLKGIEDSEGRFILFLDDIHLALQGGKGEGSEGAGMSAADLIKPMISDGKVSVIGTSTFQEYKKTISKDPAFERRFQQVSVNEPTVQDTVEILQGIRSTFEDHHDVKISNEAMECAAKLSARYVTGRFLPDKAIDCLDEACASCRMDAGNNDGVTHIEDSNVQAVISNWTKIPLQKLNMGEREKLLKLDEILSERVLGQDEAVRSVADAVLRARANLNRANGPLGSFMFVGPTGVGKTELAKALAYQLFDDEKHMCRLDMSEYMQQFSVTRMIGAPPGYAGYEEGGQLTEAVRKQPYTVVLFDEVEKAHVNVFNLLLQVLDDGRLTDGQGRTIDFSNTVVIMTSNLGSQEIVRELFKGATEESLAAAKEVCLNACKAHFRPEFINRLDALIFFKPLTKDLLRIIVRMQVSSLSKRVEERGISLHLTDEAVDTVLEMSYSPEYGARPVRRFLEKNIGTALSRVLIQEDLPECDIWMMPTAEGEEGITDDCPLSIEIRERVATDNHDENIAENQEENDKNVEEKPDESTEE